MRIYTRGGDAGKTSLFDGDRVSKDDRRVSSYGAVDELNAFMSLARQVAPQEVAAVLDRVQNELFVVGADLATPPPGPEATRRVNAQMVEDLEGDIDRFMQEVGRPGGFVLPGETEAAARLHVCRTICRRAERDVVALRRAEDVDPVVLTYVNRLSDLLYAMAVWTDKVDAGRTLRNPEY